MVNKMAMTVFPEYCSNIVSLVLLLAAHVETSFVSHLEKANNQTVESKIASNFQTFYAKQSYPRNCIRTVVSKVNQ